MKVVVHVDGGARGNPGPAAVAAVASTPDGDQLGERNAFIGEATNNVAEYRALLLGLELARDLGATEVEVVNDSELVARQIGGEYKVKHAGLKPLFLEAMRELGRAPRPARAEPAGGRAGQRGARPGARLVTQKINRTAIATAITSASAASRREAQSGIVGRGPVRPGGTPSRGVVSSSGAPPPDRGELASDSSKPILTVRPPARGARAWLGGSARSPRAGASGSSPLSSLGAVVAGRARAAWGAAADAAGPARRSSGTGSACGRRVSACGGCASACEGRASP